MSETFKVVSGGQAGADRAGLIAALKLGIEVGGWCPKGRRAEDGAIDPIFPLVETPSDQYPQRTEWNVRDSDATLIFVMGKLTPGSASTVKYCTQHKKPYLVIDLIANTMKANNGVHYPLEVAWVGHALKKYGVVNIAGSRESKSPGIQARVVDYLSKVFAVRMKE